MKTKTDQELSIEQVWENFHKSHDDYYRNLLMENYRHIVRYAAERLHAKLPDKVEVDDLISAGIFGLMDAIDAFDPERGVKFETYCSARIKGSILDELRSMDWVPRLVRARAHRLSRATNALEAHLGRKPTNEEIAEELGLNEADFTRLQKDANAVGQVSLNTKYSDGDGEKDIREIDIIKDERSENPVVEAQKRDLKNLLTVARDGEIGAYSSDLLAALQHVLSLTPSYDIASSNTNVGPELRGPDRPRGALAGSQLAVGAASARPRRCRRGGGAE